MTLISNVTCTIHNMFNLLMKNNTTNKKNGRDASTNTEVTVVDENKSVKKNSIQDLIIHLEQLEYDLNSKQIILELANFDKFSEIRRMIDIRREDLKDIVDKIALKMIDQMYAKENFYKLELAKMNIKKTPIGTIRCVEILGKNKFASGSNDTTVKIWDLKEYVCIATLTGHTTGVSCLKSLTSNTLARGSLNDIKTWSINTGTCLQTLFAHLNWMYELICMSDGLLGKLFSR